MDSDFSIDENDEPVSDMEEDTKGGKKKGGRLITKAYKVTALFLSPFYNLTNSTFIRSGWVLIDTYQIHHITSFIFSYKFSIFKLFIFPCYFIFSWRNSVCMYFFLFLLFYRRIIQYICILFIFSFMLSWSYLVYVFSFLLLCIIIYFSGAQDCSPQIWHLNIIPHQED